MKRKEEQETQNHIVFVQNKNQCCDKLCCTLNELLQS